MPRLDGGSGVESADWRVSTPVPPEGSGPEQAEAAAAPSAMMVSVASVRRFMSVPLPSVVCACLPDRALQSSRALCQYKTDRVRLARLQTVTARRAEGFSAVGSFLIALTPLAGPAIEVRETCTKPRLLRLPRARQIPGCERATSRSLREHPDRCRAHRRSFRRPTWRPGP